MYMLKRYVDVDDMIYEYIYMVQFLESSKEGLLKNRRPSNNRISLKIELFFFFRPGMSLKKYSFLRTSCPELFKENSQEDDQSIFYLKFGGMNIHSYQLSSWSNDCRVPMF